MISIIAILFLVAGWICGIKGLVLASLVIFACGIAILIAFRLFDDNKYFPLNVGVCVLGFILAIIKLCIGF